MKITREDLKTLARYVMSALGTAFCLIGSVFLLYRRRTRSFVCRATEQAFVWVGVKDPIPKVDLPGLCRSWPRKDPLLSVTVPTIDIRQIDAANGSTRPFELFLLAALVRLGEPEVLLEIGTYLGYGTCWLAANAPDTAKVYTIDLPLGSTTVPVRAADRRITKARSGSPMLYERYPEIAGKIRQFWGNSGTYDYGDLAGSVDFIYCDGDHSFAGILNDTRQSLRLLRRGGMLVWGDYSSPNLVGHSDVGKFLRRFHREVAPLFRIANSRFACLKLGREDPAQLLDRLNEVWPVSP